MSILEQLQGHADPERATGMAAYHKVPRPYLGVAVPVITAAVKDWRVGRSELDCVSEAATLWDSNIHEARVAAAKLLTKARMKDADAAAWDEIARWVPQFDGWAVADHACSAGERRVVAEPARLDTLEHWSKAPDRWTRRAALVMSLPWAKFPNPKPHQIEERERILGWAAAYVPDKDWFIQKAIAWWLRTLARHDADRVWAFMDAHGVEMRAFAAKDAVRKLPKR